MRKVHHKKLGPAWAIKVTWSDLVVVDPKCLHCEGQYCLGSSVCPQYILEKAAEAVDSDRQRDKTKTP